MIANDISKDFGFNSDYNKVSIIDSAGKVQILKNKKALC